ncbi:flagellar hook-length control protein FliK [Halomonas llamarensis]|uniref:Flagellar hook-length control protein FliK n=1 Tax=Halomonas llamarensis TaxID=2945104 RepID=A0ABT0SP95_9GAMM|nr:flagellar hook-length control protein FliK [Halomonas llamarensis]MCL7929285.1 flagellar hook-length control protein FliK [Halomonas llamarensis]
MNIHALLSMHPGQSNQATSASRSDNAQTNGFMQAFSQASHTSLSHSAQADSGNPKSGSGPVSLQQIADQLQALGLSEEQLQKADMQALMEQVRQQPMLMNALQALTASLDANTGADALPGSELFQGELADSASSLAEITQRLQLISAFEESSGSTSMSDNALQKEQQTLANALEAFNDDGSEGLAQQLAALLGGIAAMQNNGTHTSSMSDNALQKEQQSLANTLEALNDDGSEGLAQQLAALLGGIAAMQNNGTHITAANGSTESSASTLFSPSLAAMRGNAQASDAASQSEAANRALSLLDGTSANNSSRISSDALLAALSSTHNSTPAPNFELPAALQASLNGGGSPAAALQNSANGLSQGAAAQGSIATPVSSPAWSQQLGQQLVQFAQRGGEQHVKLQLHPAELGPLSISLKVGEQGTQALFLSAQAQVRQVIEQAIPQLREALAEQGISLGETSVGEQRQQNGESELAEGGSNTAGQSGSTLEGGGEDTSEPTSLPPRAVAIDGRVDLYA